jgi:hypothetical protein
MGDDQLNFTEEEAQSWADDPRNQAPKTGLCATLIVGCILLLILLVAVTAGTSSGGSTSDGGAIHAGVLIVQ